MSDKTVLTSSFKNREDAERAYQNMITRGYKPEELHVFMSDETRKKHFAGDKSGIGNKALEGTAVGGVVGGAVGATLLGIAAAAATVAVPGIGLVVAGPLAGALAGGAMGATAGGLVGTLVGAGIPEARAKVYETDLKAGGIVLGVTPRTPADTEYFEREWKMEVQPVSH